MRASSVFWCLIAQQHGCGSRRWQHSLRLDPSLELLVQPLDGIGGANAAPLTQRQSREAEEPVAGFLQAVGDGTMLEPPFADERLAPRLDPPHASPRRSCRCS